MALRNSAVRRVFAGLLCIAAASVGAETESVRGASLAVGVNAANGRVESIAATNGTEFAARRAADLFSMELTRADDFSAKEKVGPSQAKRFPQEALPDGIRLVWEDLGGKVARVECTVKTAPGDAKVRFRLSFVPTNGWAVISTDYPCLRLADRIGPDTADDRLLTGAAWGGIHLAPGADPKPRVIESRRQPGNLSVQAALWWDPSALFYFAAEDDKGDVKHLVVRRTADGILFLWQRHGFDAEPTRLDYDFTAAALCGTPQDPVTWHDGAELYRAWARTTHFCSVPTARRTDIPSWLADAPALTLFTRDWFDKPDTIRRWVKDCWGRVAPGVPIVAASWGWEHFYTWVHPYFPCHPSDEAFTSLVADLAAEKAYIFPWPSGYHWTLTYGKNADGTYQNDWRADFNREAAAYACMNRDGTLYDRVPSLNWLKGGSMAAMCGGTDWTQRWWNEDVVGGLARRGCRIVQADQNNGGAFPPCWNRNHPHPPGDGRWKTVAARRQMAGMIEAIRKIHGEGAATYEEPNEQFNDLVGIQLLRDSRPKTEWASLYGYLYHEYVPMFQPYPPRGDLRWMAYSAAEGHMPRFVPARSDFELNGLAVPSDFLAGPFGGDGTNKFHVGKNVSVDDKLFTPGTRFRLTAVCRTRARPKSSRELHLHYGVYTKELKALARGYINFPQTAEEGPQTLTSEFTMPEGPAQMLRIMLNAAPEAKGEVGDMKLEVVHPDGSTEPARLKGSRWHNDYMRRWVALHRGEGRPWLAHGRRIKPPRLSCASVESDGRPAPAVFIAAYESLDGRRAYVLANATHEAQDVRCTFSDEREQSLRLAPAELRLEMMPPVSQAVAPSSASRVTRARR